MSSTSKKTKIILKNIFEEEREKQGTIDDGESLTDQSQAEDTDIYVCLRKYGIQTLVNQTQAKEYLYLDNTNRNMTLDEAVRRRQELNEYFLQQPARVRKVFGDDVNQFIEKYNRGDFEDFKTTGILNEEIITQITEERLGNKIEIDKPVIQEPIVKGELTNEQE